MPDAFPADYDWELVTEFAGAGSESVGEFGTGEHTPVAVRITPRGGVPWVAYVRGGGRGVDLVLPSPNPRVLLVVADGDGHLIDVVGRTARPLHTLIRQAVAAPHHGVVLLVDWNRITALGSDGIVWTSDSLVDDALVLDAVVGEVIRCHGDNLADGRGAIHLEVSVRDGRLAGGSTSLGW